MEPIHLDDIVQSALCHRFDREMAPLPGLREKGRKESLRESLGEEGNGAARTCRTSAVRKASAVHSVCRPEAKALQTEPPVHTTRGEMRHTTGKQVTHNMSWMLHWSRAGDQHL